jgi:hypothetical protein
MSIINVPNHDLKFYRGDTATTAQLQGVFGFVEKELPVEWVEVGV